MNKKPTTSKTKSQKKKPQDLSQNKPLPLKKTALKEVVGGICLPGELAKHGGF